VSCEKKQETQSEQSESTSALKTPEFILTDQHENPFSSDQLQGKPWVVNFIFTACPSICPEVTKNLVQVHSSTNSEHVTFVTITVDPENDTSSNLLAYAKKMGADHKNWKFLTGKRDEVWRLSKEKFRLPVAEGGNSKHGIIAHSSKVLLFQNDGSLSKVYEGTSQEDMDKLQNDLRGLLPMSGDNESRYSARITVPDDFGLTKKWIKKRQAEQVASKDKIDAPVNFQFNDRQQQSGIDFRHYIVDCAGKNYRSAHYDHGNGIAIADVDGDGMLDVYLVSQIGPCGLYRNLGKGKFADITEKAGVAARESISSAASFADIDNDGDPDLYLTNTRYPNQLFLNKGDGTFEDVSKNSGADYNEHCSAAVFFDYNNDGLLDLFLCVVGQFTTDELAEVEGTPETHPIKGPVPNYYVAFKDAFAGHLKPEERARTSRLFQNTGQGKFKDVTDAMGLIEKGWSGAAIPVDFNRDGFQDLYVVSMQGLDSYWENKEGKKFIDKSRELFPVTPWGAMGVKSFDHNNDGHMDLYITDMHSDMSLDIGPTEEKEKSIWMADRWGNNYLNDGGRRISGNGFFQNNGAGAFKEMSDELNMENYWPWGFSVGDLNADGWQDAFICASMNYPFRYGINTALINNKGKGFKDAEFILGIEPRKNGLTTPWFQLDASGADSEHRRAKGHQGKVLVLGSKGSRSSAIFDLDNDGDLDIITNEFGDVPQVLMSDLSAEDRKINYIKIKLRGVKSNRDALGARVTVTSGSLTQTQVHDGQSGYLSQSSMPLYFGLGEMKKIDSIEVRWPSGAQTKLTHDLKINGILEIMESSPSN
jgi:cytochrome oxidase Cu insertion factor (SCO1/SenC/PrrC family)